LIRFGFAILLISIVASCDDTNHIDSDEKLASQIHSIVHFDNSLGYLSVNGDIGYISLGNNKRNLIEENSSNQHLYSMQDGFAANHMTFSIDDGKVSLSSNAAGAGVNGNITLFDGVDVYDYTSESIKQKLSVPNQILENTIRDVHRLSDISFFNVSTTDGKRKLVIISSAGDTLFEHDSLMIDAVEDPQNQNVYFSTLQNNHFVYEKNTESIQPFVLPNLGEFFVIDETMGFQPELGGISIFNYNSGQFEEFALPNDFKKIYDSLTVKGQNYLATGSGLFIGDLNKGFEHLESN